MTVRQLLNVCGNDLKVKIRVTRERKVRYNIIENRVDIALSSLSSEVLCKVVSNIYTENANNSLFKPTLIINIEE